MYEPVSMMFAYGDAGVTVALPRFWDAGTKEDPQLFDLETFLTLMATRDIQGAAALPMARDWHIDHVDYESVLREDVDEDVDLLDALATLMRGVLRLPLLTCCAVRNPVAAPEMLTRRSRDTHEMLTWPSAS